MIHIVDYELTRTYSGRMALEAASRKDAEEQVKSQMPSTLSDLAASSSFSISARSSPPIDASQLDLFPEDSP